MLKYWKLAAIALAASIALAGCSGPAKEAASSAPTDDATTASSQPEETTDLPSGESSAASAPEETAGQTTPSTASRTDAPTASRKPTQPPKPTAKPTAKPTTKSTATAAKTTRSTAAPTKAPTEPPAVSLAEYAEAVVRLVNQERAKAGLDSLSVNQAAAAAANVRAGEIAGTFSHTRPDGSSFSTALKEQNAAYYAAGENIAYGQRSAEQVMKSWMNSSGHRANILNAQYTAIGVGVYRSASGTLHWVQLFIG